MADHDERHLLTTMRSMVHGRRPISPCPSGDDVLRVNTCR
jgi:uncharacterized protein (DUF2249 family)